eukprot:3022050-Alexandrium_andersonii.AAC.1
MMRKQLMAEVEREYGAGNLHIAPLAALVKADQSCRVLHDASHGPQVNPRIVQRDAVPLPSMPELK